MGQKFNNERERQFIIRKTGNKYNITITMRQKKEKRE